MPLSPSFLLDPFLFESNSEDKSYSKKSQFPMSESTSTVDTSSQFQEEDQSSSVRSRKRVITDLQTDSETNSRVDYKRMRSIN